MRPNQFRFIQEYTAIIEDVFDQVKYDNFKYIQDQK